MERFILKSLTFIFINTDQKLPTPLIIILFKDKIGGLSVLNKVLWVKPPINLFYFRMGSSGSQIEQDLSLAKVIKGK